MRGFKGIIVPKFRSATGADVVILWRIWKLFVKANWASKVHSVTLAHSYAKYVAIPPWRIVRVALTE
jgi:hypothetical protein